MVSPGIRVTRRSTSVVFPAPDGADTMNSSPLLNVLDLFPHLLQLGLRGDDQLGHLEAVGLRAHRVDLAVHLLQQEIELAAARFGAVRQRLPVRHVAAEATTSSLMSDRAAM